MDYKTAKALLEFYPLFYRRNEDQREDILESYSSPFANTGRHGTGGYSDPTAAKGVKLADLGESNKALGKVIEFMDTLSPEQREMILTVWRYGCSTWKFIDWKAVARHMKMHQVTCRLAWEQMITNFQAFVGAANGHPGIASAGGQQNQSPA